MKVIESTPVDRYFDITKLTEFELTALGRYLGHHTPSEDRLLFKACFSNREEINKACNFIINLVEKIGEMVDL